MIVEKRPLLDDPTPNEDPPSYETIGQCLSIEDTKVKLEDDLVSPAPSPASTPLNIARNSGSIKKDKAKARSPKDWFTSHSAARTSREVHSIVLGLLRDLVQDNTSKSPSAAGVLKSCADACAAHNVSLSSILQQKFIEDHTPIYWTIVKRLPDSHPDLEDNQGPDFLTSLIAYASPLKEATITDIRLACLAASDQKLFQRLRQMPEICLVSTVNQMLLGTRAPPDEIEVEDNPSDAASFVAAFVIPMFHKRIMVSKEITLEFIAKSRLWKMTFFVARADPTKFGAPPEGSWCISLSLQESSPPTHLDSRLLISEASIPNLSPSRTSSPESSPALEFPSSSLSSPHSPFQPHIPGNLLSLKLRRAKPTIFIRLKTSTRQLQAAAKSSPGYQIVEPFEKSLTASKLQYSNNPYIGPDESLRARFEARLGKPDSECIIC